MKLTPMTRLRRAIAGGMLVALLAGGAALAGASATAAGSDGGGAVLSRSADAGSQFDTGLIGFARNGRSTMAERLGELASVFDIDDRSAKDAVRAAAVAAIDSLEADGSLDPREADRLERLVPRIIEETSPPTGSDDDPVAVPPSLDQAAQVLGLRSGELARLIDDGSAEELLRRVDIDAESTSDAAVAAAQAAVHSLEADGVIDAGMADTLTALIPTFVPDAVDSALDD